MSRGRPRYFTVSETLQAVLDEMESDDDRDDEVSFFLRVKEFMMKRLL